MDRREKIEFLLEQMRLCLAKEDYIRTQIISKKINIKAFEDEASHVSFNENSNRCLVHLYNEYIILRDKIHILQFLIA
jgi:hypothetical protein